MAAITSAILAAGAVATQAEQTRQQARAAKVAGREAKVRQAEQEKEIRSQEETKEARAAAIKKRQTARGKQASAGKQGRAGTILGGAPAAGTPPGTSQGGAPQTKTLLGA